MSYSISAQATNQNSQKFIDASKDDYDIDEGITQYGEIIEEQRCEWLEETDDEYGGVLIDLSKLPKDATHVWVYRS